jgi:hypothetical protein
MKRSTQVSLVLLAAVGVGGAAVAMMPDRCRTQPPSAVAGDAPQECRATSHGSSGWHGGSSYFSSSSGDSKSGGSGSSSSGSEGTARGGFGSTGHAFASLGG